MNERIERINALLSEANKSLNAITNENFDKTMADVKTMLNESLKHRAFLLTNFSEEELKNFEPDLTRLTKQIKESFDNIIANKKTEIEKIRLQIEYTQNRKKLVNYIR